MHDNDRRELRRLIAEGVRQAIDDWWKEVEEYICRTGDTGIRVTYFDERESDDGVRTVKRG